MTGPIDPHEQRWQQFLAELPARICAILSEEAPLLCPTCGSTTPAAVERKTCSACRRELPVSAFRRNRAMHGGRDYYCRECRRGMRAEQWQRQKRRAVGIEREAF